MLEQKKMVFFGTKQRNLVNKISLFVFQHIYLSFLTNELHFHYLKYPRQSTPEGHPNKCKSIKQTTK